MLEEFIKHKTELLTIIKNIEVLTKENQDTADDRLLMI